MWVAVDGRSLDGRQWALEAGRDHRVVRHDRDVVAGHLKSAELERSKFLLL